MILYGTPSSRYKYFKQQLDACLKYAGIDDTMVEVNDLDEILRNNIDSIPAIATDRGTMLSSNLKGSIDLTLKAIVNVILQENNYGKMKRILIPVDFSDVSLNAYVYGLQLAKATSSHITLVHFYHPNISSDKSEKQLKGQLDAIVESNSHGSSVNFIYTDTLVKERLAADGIVELSEDYDLIVMGTTGTGNGFNRWINNIMRDDHFFEMNAICKALREVFQFVFRYLHVQLTKINIEA